MAGIPGQPGTKPSQLSSPVPDTMPEGSALADFEPPKGSALADFDPNAGATSDVIPDSTFGISAEGLARGALDALPTVGGVVGGGLGAAAGLTAGPGAPVAVPVAGVAGAAAGGALGQKLKSDLETLLFGQTQSREQYYGGIKDAAVEQGAGEALGLGIGAGASKIAQSGAAKKFGAVIAEKLSAPLNYMKTEVGSLIDEVQRPLTEMLTRKATPLNTEQAGNAAKELLKKNIQGKYGPFIQAYSDLETVGKALPYTDKANLKFFDQTMDWARSELGGDNYRIVKKFSQDLNAAQNGAQFDSVVKTIRDAKRTAYGSQATELGKVLGSLEERATNFMDNEVTKLAQKVSAGKATPAELQFIQGIAQQRGAAPEEATKYAKQLASDYLKSKDLVKRDYAHFKSFLEDVGEQTRVRTGKTGPTAFLSAIEDVPSEKLIERMFDPKNAAALRRMQKETPEVFDQVVKSKMSEVMRASSPDGRLDLKAVRKAVNKLPPSTREFLMAGDDMKIMNAVLDDPKLARLEHLDKLGENILMKWGGQVAEAAGIGAERAVSAGSKVLQKKVPSQLTGRGVRKAGSALVNAFGSQEEQ